MKFSVIWNLYIFSNLTMLRGYQPGIWDKGAPFPARTKQLAFLHSGETSSMSHQV